MIRVALAGPGNGEAPLSIAFEVRGGGLLAGVVRPGWAERLEPGPGDVLADALVGLYRTAGVDLIHQQIEAVLSPGCPYALVERGLIVVPDDAPGARVLYDLTEESAQISPQILSGTPSRPPAVLLRSQLVFRGQPLWWQHWVAIWQPHAALRTDGPPPLACFPVLPAVPHGGEVPQARSPAASPGS
jgi:hypothetical protein